MNGIIRNIIPTVLCVALGFGTPAVLAKNQCKGMSKSACTADESCSWVKGYVSKSGNKVDPYCRVKAKKKKAGEKQSGDKDKGNKAQKSKGDDKGKKKMKEQEKKQGKDS